MAEKQTWLCDGCDQEIEGDYPAAWKRYKVTVRKYLDDREKPLREPSMQYTFDVCSDCEDAFLRGYNPNRWPRNATNHKAN